MVSVIKSLSSSWAALSYDKQTGHLLVAESPPVHNPVLALLRAVRCVWTLDHSFSYRHRGYLSWVAGSGLESADCKLITTWEDLLANKINGFVSPDTRDRTGWRSLRVRGLRGWSICRSVYLSASSLCLSVSVWLSICLPVYLSVPLPASVSVSLCRPT